MLLVVLAVGLKLVSMLACFLAELMSYSVSAIREQAKLMGKLDYGRFGMELIYKC